MPRTPAELLAAEKSALLPLPLHIPEVYVLHRRRVGVEGYLHLHTNRYPVADAHIGRWLDMHETTTEVRIFDGHKLVVHYDKRQCIRFTPPCSEQLAAQALKLSSWRDRDPCRAARHECGGRTASAGGLRSC